MTYCPSCRVSLAPGAVVCPLCQTKSAESSDSIPDARAPSLGSHGPVTFAAEVRNADEKEKLTPAEKRFMVFELLAVSFSIMLIISIGINVLLVRGLTWSMYTSLILVMVWLFCAIPLLLWGHPWLIYAVLGPSLLLGVFLWAVASGDLRWFLVPGMPITLLIEAAVLSSFVLVSIQKNKGLNSAGVILAASVLLCAGIDMVIGYTAGRGIGLSWSVIVLVAVLPVAGFFFYLHYRVINRASLRKIFRL